MVAPVDQLIALRTPADIKTIENAESWDEHLRTALLPHLDGLSAKQLASLSSPDTFAKLNPAQDTLPFLYILQEQIHAASSKSKSLPPALVPGGDIWGNVSRFILESDDVEIRYGGLKTRQLLEYLANVAHLGRPNEIEVLQYMAGAMLKIDRMQSTLTSSHLAFLRSCLELQDYANARHILDNKEIVSLPVKESTCTPLQAEQRGLLSHTYITKDSKLTLSITRPDVLEFYLYGAMVYIALKQWHRALYFLEHVLATPTNHTANGNMLEAYKKWVLVGLLARGKSASPQNINPTALRTIRNAAKPYDALADAFMIEDGRKLAAEIHETWPILLEDGNSGLASNVFSYHRVLSVSKLAKIYVSVPLGKIAQQLRSSEGEAQEYLGRLIDDGYLSARIEQTESAGEKVLRFSQPGRDKAINTVDEHKSEAQLLAELTEQTQRLDALSECIEDADKRMALSKEYLEHTRKARKNKDVEGGMDEVDGSFGGRIPSDDEDENVMADNI